MDTKSLKRLELDKILYSVSGYAVLDGGKRRIRNCVPSADLGEVRLSLDCTEECGKLLYVHGTGKIGYFGEIDEILVRAEKGSVLSCAELLDANALLRSARTAFESVNKISDESITLIRSKIDGLYFDGVLENDVAEKIISFEAVSDFASDRLFTIRSRIKNLNEKIRSKLSEYLTKDAKYLQDGIVTIRNDRYVIPVKAEYKNQVRGFVHDRSQTGATFFIEPEYVLELNNELIALTIDEREEVENILRGLSARFGKISAQLKADMEILSEIDEYYARAEYCYAHKCVKPKINGKGYINIIKGRHPLIDGNKIVPVSVELGNGYDFLLLSGANTGGKTVTLKMCGLFSLMTACGLFIPCAEGSSISVFENVFCDAGDSQSIEESLSTFSSHLLNVIEFCNGADSNSLVLIDELGSGTNPDEGQALAKAVVKHLLSKGCKGIVTTHFTPLKEFAYTVDGIENASMEFDSDTLKPLYKMKTGLPGASNALAISRRLGLDENILNDAYGFLSEGARSFENVVRRAEESRVEADEKLIRLNALEKELENKIAVLNSEIEEVNREKEKISRSARSESRRIVNERTEQAEKILSEIEEIFKAGEIDRADLIKARTLKNKLENISYGEEEERKKVNDFKQADGNNLTAGATVFVTRIQSRGKVLSVSAKKNEAEVLCGNMKLRCKISDLLITGEEDSQSGKVKIIRNIPLSKPVLEINILGLTVEEAIYETDNFIDKAVTDNLEEIKIIHGVGTGKLRAALSKHLARHKNVESFRSGRYGEGETGVTVIRLK